MLTCPPLQVPHLPIILQLVAGRMLNLLRERSGHGHLRVRSHVSVLQLWPAPQKDGQRLLPNLQESY